MDQTDYKIVRILCKDARTPFQRIAKTLGIGTDTVIRRYNKLKEDGVILGSTVVLNSKVCGFKGLFAVFLKLKSGTDLLTVKNKLINDFRFNLVLQELGDYDFYVQLYLVSIEETVEIVRNLRALKEFDAIDPMFYTGEDWVIPAVLTINSGPPDWSVYV